MFGRKTACEVLVVGAGPVGLFAALQLARRGIDVEIIDSQWRTAARSYALALHPRSLELFAELELLEPMLDAGRRVDSVGFYDGDERRAGLDFGQLEYPNPFLLVTPQNLLEEALEERLAEDGVRVKWSHRLAGLDLGADGVTATVQRLGKESTGYSVSATEWVVEKTLTVESRFVIGADGHHSAVRRLAGIEFEELPGAQQFAVFECGSNRDPGGEMRVVLEEGRTSVFWPLPGNRCRWSFEFEEDREAGERIKQRLAIQVGEKSYPYLSPESLADLLAERAPWFELETEEVHWSVGVRFDRRVAREFGRGPVSLLGDAAHMAGPVGVQSMNSGFADARLVGRLMVDAVREGGSPSEIGRLDSDRAAEWKRLSELGAGDSKNASATAWVQARAGRLPACIPALGDDLGQLLTQLDLHA